MIIMKKNQFMLVRHSYDDHSYIDGKNDTSLTKDGIEIAKKASKDILREIDDSKVIIRYSSKKRAKETAEIICECFLHNNIDCYCVEDCGLTELFQGTFNFDGMEHTEKINFLQSCWDDFEECRMQGDLNHNFGQNKDHSIVLTSGENHSEWSVRISCSLLNIIDDLSHNFQSVNVTHRGAIFEIQGIIGMINQQIEMDQIEKYETLWMPYCQSYLLQIENFESARALIKKYIYQRSNK